MVIQQYVIVDVHVNKREPKFVDLNYSGTVICLQQHKLFKTRRKRNANGSHDGLKKTLEGRLMNIQFDTENCLLLLYTVITDSQKIVFSKILIKAIIRPYVNIAFKLERVFSKCSLKFT